MTTESLHIERVNVVGDHTTSRRFRHVLALRQRASTTATMHDNLSIVIARSKSALSIGHAFSKQGDWIWAAFLFHLMKNGRPGNANNVQPTHNKSVRHRDVAGARGPFDGLKKVMDHR